MIICKACNKEIETKKKDMFVLKIGDVKKRSRRMVAFKMLQQINESGFDFFGKTSSRNVKESKCNLF